MQFIMPRNSNTVLGTAIRVAMTLGVLAGAGRLTAQAPDVKPAPEHAVLKEWEGSWDSTVKMQGNESKGTLSAKVGLNGLWLIEEFKGEFAGMPFEGHGVTTYDPAKKKYINVWIDSMSTSPVISEGTYDKATKTLKLAG